MIDNLTQQISIFIIFLILPVIYNRGLFYIAKKVFDKPYLRTKTGLQIHHIHYGIVAIFISALILLFSSRNFFVIALMGLGLGWMLDEFIPSLLLPGNRPVELDVYNKSFRKTIILFATIILLVLILYFIGF